MKYGLLVARQRSGTGAIGTVLDQHRQIKYLGEIFHPNNTGDEKNFFTFLLEQVAQDPKNALPDMRPELFRRFLEMEAERHGGHQTIVVDIKYNSLHHLDVGWRDPLRVPNVVQQAMRDNAPIIHLTRRNAVESFVSLRLAEANNVWHTQKDDQYKTTQIALNIRDLSAYVVMMEREIELIAEWLKGYSNTINIDYGDAFEADGALIPGLIREFEEKFEVEAFEKLKPVFVKQAPTALDQSIENYALVKRALQGTPYQWMVK